jgi:predicted DNA-binding transcriptional regulator AlpA
LAGEQRADAQRAHYLSLAAARRAKQKQRRASKLKTLHRRNGDRASPDDGAPRLTTYVRFNDLVAAGIVRNWPTLARLIRQEGFPVGKMLSSHARAWPLRDVEKWLAERPTINDDVRLRRRKRVAVEA